MCRLRRPEFAELRITKNVQEIAALGDELDRHGELLRSPLALFPDKREQISRDIEIAQHKIMAAEMERRRLDKIVVTLPPPPGVLSDEFLRICSTPSVYEVEMCLNNLIVRVEARFEYKGATYHLGDWAIDIDLSSDQIWVVEDVSGLHEELQGNLGSLQNSQYSWDWGFCFGSNVGLVSDLVEAGKYVDAIQVAASYMNQVNPEHLSRIKDLYRKVD